MKIILGAIKEFNDDALLMLANSEVKASILILLPLLHQMRIFGR